MSQLDKARVIQQHRIQGTTFKEIGQILDMNPEACRSILRRYESNLNNDIDILNVLDNEYDFTECTSKKAEEKCKQIDEYECEKKYGTYLWISDTHEPYCRRQLIKEILLLPEVQEIDTVILGGDIGQFDVASKWQVETDDVIDTTLTKMSELFEVFSSQFKKVYIIPGNHDSWTQRELTRSIKNGLRRLVKDISPIQIVIDELYEKGITNLEYTIQNDLALGNVMFAHPNEFCATPGQTVIRVADAYLTKKRDLSAVIIGHTHNIFASMYRGIAVYEGGCMCYDMEYKKKSKINKTLWVPAYGIFKIDEDGNLDTKKSKVVAMV